MPAQPLSQTPTQRPPQTQLPTTTTTGLPLVPGVSGGVIAGVIGGLIGVAIIVIIIIVIVHSIWKWKYSPSKCDYCYYCTQHMFCTRVCTLCTYTYSSIRALVYTWLKAISLCVHATTDPVMAENTQGLMGGSE